MSLSREVRTDNTRAPGDLLPDETRGRDIASADNPVRSRGAEVPGGHTDIEPFAAGTSPVMPGGDGAAAREHAKSLTFPRVVPGSEEALNRVPTPAETVETLPITPSASNKERLQIQNEAAGYKNRTEHSSASGVVTVDASKPMAYNKASGATAVGTGVGDFTPIPAIAPANLAGMTGIIAKPLTAWTTGQHMVLKDASKTYWNGTAWVVGQAAVEDPETLSRKRKAGDVYEKDDNEDDDEPDTPKRKR